MAEPPKPKRPSRDKKPPEPDFSPFEDWLIDGPAGEWPMYWESKKELSEEQKRIVAVNARDLSDRDAWLNKVQAFESALSALADEAGQKRARAKYHIRFDRHAFKDGPKDFSDYSFPCSVSFVGAEFGEGDVWFRRAKFGEGNVSFVGAEFGKGYVSFYGTEFGEGDVSFRGAEFGEGKVSFYGAKFGEGDVWLVNIDFRSTAIPAAGMAVAGNLYVKSHFPEAVNFSRLDVEGTASFSGSSFDKVPDFTDAKFDRPPEVAGMRVPRPKLKGCNSLAADPEDVARFRKLKGWNSLAADSEDVAKFRKLKSMALAANDHERDGEFFAGEMLAKRGTETTSFAGLLFNTLYWKISDFGQSFTLPLLWLFHTFLVFAATNLLVISCLIAATRATISSYTQAIAFSIVLSLKNAVPLLGSLFRFAPAPEGHKGWFQEYYNTLKDDQATVDLLISLGVVESIAGGVLLFLFLLALRNRFRLR